MVWKTVQERRWEFVTAWRENEKDLRQLLTRFGISRQTAYRWRGQYRKRGLPGLEERSRRPKQLTWIKDREAWEARIGKMHSHWKAGAKKLRILLANKYGESPSQASIGRILRRLQLSRSRPRRECKLLSRVQSRLTQPTWPNRVWGVDFKGQFSTLDGKVCCVLTGSDLYSRYVVLCEALNGVGQALVRKKMRRCFERYGLPEVIRVDNGQPFGSSGRGALGLSSLSTWWIRLGIEVEYMDVGSPQQNGAHERMHGSYKREAADPPAQNCRRQQLRNERWRKYFNEERVHEGLNLEVPKEHYQLSVRKYEGELPYKYSAGWLERVIKDKGDMHLFGRRRYVGEAFGKQTVGLEPIEFREGVWRVWFRSLRIGELHQSDPGGMRPRLLKRTKRKARK